MEHNWQQRLALSALGRFLVALAAVAVVMIAPALPAMAAGTTPQTIDPPTLPVSVSAPSTLTVPSDATSGLPLTITVNSNPANICSISGQRVNFTALGTCYINYDQPGDATYAAAPRLTVSVLVENVQAVILGATPHTMSILDAPYQATLTTSTGAAINYFAVTTPGSAPNCSVTVGGQITPLAVGACQVLMNVTSADPSNVVTGTFNIQITKANQASLSIVAPTRLDPSGQATIQVSGGSGAGAVTVAAAGDCTVSGMVVTAASSGSSCTITATKDADATYYSASASQTFSVAVAPVSPPVTSTPAPVTPSAPTNSTPPPVTSTPAPSTSPSSDSAESSGEVVFTIDQVATKLLKPSLDATDVWNNAGGALVLTGHNLLKVSRIRLSDGTPVKILGSTDSSLTLRLPMSSLIGWQSMTFTAAGVDKVFKDVFRFINPSAAKSISKVLTGFKAKQRVLTRAQMITLQKFARSVGSYRYAECRGLVTPSTLTCKYLKKLFPAAGVRVTKVSIRPSSPLAKQVRLVFSK